MSQTMRAAASEYETPAVAAANAVLQLAREAVRIAVEYGGDQAAGALRLLLADLSPMPAAAETETVAAGDRPDGGLHSAESDANFLRGLATMRKHQPHAKRLHAIAAALAPATGTKET